VSPSIVKSALTAIAAALAAVAACDAYAFDDAKYPEMRAQWVRIGSASFDPDKPGGRGQQPPLTPEYQALLEEVFANRAVGSLEGNNTVTCIPSGMPRAMIVYETMDVIIVPETTYIRMSYMNELRRIHTDGRNWPAKITPSFIGHSIGQWADEDRDGRFDTLTIETRGFRGPRTFDGTPGIPLHKDNQTVIKERIYLDKADRDVLHADITVSDNALTRPWSVARKYQRVRDPFWSEYVCNEGNQQVLVGKENYMVSADGYLMPVKKDQPPPDLRYFNQPPRK
jgi:hypothetical protein